MFKMFRGVCSLFAVCAAFLWAGASAADVLPAWRAIGDDASANAVIRCGAGQPPVRYADLTRRGSVELPVAGPDNRVLWDFSLPFDFMKADELSFDLRVDDLSGIKHASMHLKSGDGWYTTGLPVQTEGEWQRIRWNRRRRVSREGKPAGLDRIDAIRLSFYRTDERKTTTAVVADFALSVVRDARVLVLRGETSAQRRPKEAKDFRRLATVFESALERLNVPYVGANDDAVAATAFEGKSVAVLPFNAVLPPETLAHLKAFVARGGRLFVLYSLPAGVGELLGVANAGFRRSGDKGAPRFAGLLRAGAGLEGQPAFTPQASNNANEPRLTGPGEVVAFWGDAQNRSLGIPALVKTSTGVYMGHVWQPAVAKDGDALLTSILGALDPTFKASFAAADVRAKELAAKRQAFVRSVPGKAGERRLVWCHTAYGMTPDMDWDASVKFLKENGFTDLIANLTWADCAFYDSKVLPVPASVATRGDAFELCKAACRKYGVGFHVWRVCYNMGGFRDAARVAQYRAEGRLVQAFDVKSKNPWATAFCPSHPENQRREVESMVELARKGADGIHFDYIRYADGNFCFCDGCRRRFEAETGRTIADWPADVRKDGALAAAWTRWRAETITAVVAETARRVRAEFPKVEISIAARADRDSAYAGDGQDWARWAKEGWIDILCPMDYTDSTPFFRNTFREQREILAGTRVKLYPGIGLSCWREDGAEAEKLARHIQALRQEGLDGFTVFALDRRAQDALPKLREGPTRD